jgi:hypothetical protein
VFHEAFAEDGEPVPDSLRIPISRASLTATVYREVEQLGERFMQEVRQHLCEAQTKPPARCVTHNKTEKGTTTCASYSSSP